MSIAIRKYLPKVPNVITIFGAVIGLLSVYFLYKEMYVLALSFFWFSYYLDCLDGYYARKYDMITKLGDYLDHVRDVLIGFAVLIIIYFKLPEKFKLSFVIVISVSLILFLSHMGCQEKHSKIKDHHNDCLAIFKHMCKHENWINTTKYFGNGTFISIISMFIIVLKFLHK